MQCYNALIICITPSLAGRRTVQLPPTRLTSLLIARRTCNNLLQFSGRGRQTFNLANDSAIIYPHCCTGSAIAASFCIQRDPYNGCLGRSNLTSNGGHDIISFSFANSLSRFSSCSSRCNLANCWAKSMWRPMSREADLPVRLEPSAGASR